MQITHVWPIVTGTSITTLAINMYNSLGAHVWLATPHPSPVIGYSAPIHRDWLLRTHPPWLATPHSSTVIGYSAPIHHDWLLCTHPLWLATLHPSPVIGYSTPIHRDWLLRTIPLWLATPHPRHTCVKPAAQVATSKPQNMDLGRPWKKPWWNTKM